MEGTVFFKIVGNGSPCAIHIPEDLNPHSLVDLGDIDRSVSCISLCNLEYPSENIISNCSQFLCIENLPFNPHVVLITVLL